VLSYLSDNTLRICILVTGFSWRNFLSRIRRNKIEKESLAEKLSFFTLHFFPVPPTGILGGPSTFKEAFQDSVLN
jgi:hypothetical protein